MGALFMNRLLTVAAFFLLFATACQSQPSRINHVVMIKLHDETAQPSLQMDCDRLLPSIPGVDTYWCGQHGDFGRTGIDDNYDVALCVGFNRSEDYAAYLIHPQHLELVNTWKPQMEWIRIYDVVDESR